MSSELLSTKGAAIRLGVTPIRIRALIRAGRLPSQLIGRDHIIKASDLALVAERKPGRPKKERASAVTPTTETTAQRSAPQKTKVVTKKPMKKGKAK